MLKFQLIACLLAAAAVAGDIRLTLESAPAYAMRHNPALAAARLRIEEARGRLHQAGRLANPEIELELNRNIRAPEGAVAVAFMQKFPLTARLRLEKAVTRAELAAAEAEVRNAERKLAAEVSTASVKLLGVDAQKALRERQLGLSRELSTFTQKRVEVGEASLVDASLVELEAQQLQTEVLQLDAERAMLIGDLRPLLGMSVGDVPVIAGTLPPTGRLPSRGANLSQRPDYAAAQSSAEAARQSAALARAQKWDDIGLGLNATGERSEDAPEGFQRETFVGFRLTLPLPLWDDNSGRVQEATAAAVRAEKEIDALALTINAEARAARDTMAVLAKLLTSLNGDLLPKASLIEEQLRTSYSTGQTALTEVLRARDRRLLIERQRVDALRDYHLARIRHDAAIGRGVRATRATRTGK